MNVSPISKNLSFQAKFKKTPTLERMLITADKSTLGRFNDVLKNADKVKNDAVYKFSSQAFSDEFSPNVTTITFYLHKVCNSRLSLENFISIERITPKTFEEKMLLSKIPNSFFIKLSPVLNFANGKHDMYRKRNTEGWIFL